MGRRGWSPPSLNSICMNGRWPKAVEWPYITCKVLSDLIDWRAIGNQCGLRSATSGQRPVRPEPRVPSPVPKQHVGGFWHGSSGSCGAGHTNQTRSGNTPSTAPRLARHEPHAVIHALLGRGVGMDADQTATLLRANGEPSPLVPWGYGMSISRRQHLYSGGIQPRVDHPTGGRMRRDGLASHIGVRWHTKHVLSDPFFLACKPLEEERHR
jgi:hypothetical protein